MDPSVFQIFCISDLHSPLFRSNNIQDGGIRAALFHTTASRLEEVKIVKCPPFAESITEGDVRWEVEVGDSVSEDQVLIVQEGIYNPASKRVEIMNGAL